MRAYALLVWFLVGFCGMFGAGLTFAETVPATSSDVTVSVRWMMNQQTYRYAGSHDAACNAWDYETASTVYDYRAATYSSGTTYGCEIWQTNKSTGASAKSSTLAAYYQTSCDGFGTVRTSSASVSGYEAAASYVCSIGYACPANQGWTLSGSTCTRADCGAGEIRNQETGLCMAVCAAGAPAMGQVSGALASTYCQGGCMYPRSSATCFGGSCIVTLGPGTGQACGASEPDAPAPTTSEADCAAAGKGWATINGVTTCAAGASDSPVTDYETNQKQTTNPDGSSSSSQTETATSNSGDSVTRTTSTTDASGTTTTTTTTSKAGFCEENPSAAICKAADNPCSEANDKISCAEFGEVGDPGELTSSSRGASSIVPVSVPSSFGCPADVQLPKGLVFSYSGACEFAEGVRPVVLAMAWLIAGLIAFGFKSE